MYQVQCARFLNCICTTYCILCTYGSVNLVLIRTRNILEKVELRKFLLCVFYRLYVVRRCILNKDTIFSKDSICVQAPKLTMYVHRITIYVHRLIIYLPKPTIYLFVEILEQNYQYACKLVYKLFLKKKVYTKLGKCLLIR